MPKTTIPVSTKIRDALFYCKRPGDSYDDVIRREILRADPDEILENVDPDDNETPGQDPDGIVAADLDVENLGSGA